MNALFTSQAVCVIDTECEVDVEDTEPAAPSVVVISPGVPTTGVVSPQSILRYDFPIPTSSFSSLHFTLTVQPSPSSVCGDVDLYITSSDLPASRHQWEWRNVDISPIKYIQIGSGDVSLVGRPMLHIAVVPYFAEGAAVTVGCGTISLVVQVETAAPLPSATPEPSLGVASGGTEPCPNCGVLVSNPSLDRHVAFCTRNNYRCSTCMKVRLMYRDSKWSCLTTVCDQVMRISERGTHAHCPRCSAVVHPDGGLLTLVCFRLLRSSCACCCAGLEKHIALDHTAFVCECGCSVDPSLLSMHKSFECDLRPVPCTYCGAMFPERKLHSHEEYCGGRTQPCVECGAVMLVKLLADHVSRGCAPVSSEGKAAPPPGYLSWLREVNAGDSATCATIADDSAEMDTSSPVPVTHARVSADECEYQYSDDDDETGYEYQPPARTVYAAPSSRPVSTSDLPPYLAPGNGAVTITDSESDVMLIATVSRLDLVGEDSWVCPSCSEGFATKPLLQVQCDVFFIKLMFQFPCANCDPQLHQGSLCPKRK